MTDRVILSMREPTAGATETRRFNGDYGVAFRMRFDRLEDAEAFAGHIARLFPELGSIAIDRQIARVKLKPAENAA
ncbi:hypothetical protein [uncultured Sphingomonas sp.]|uniref:hypothetical protein n=1 Tax=uncultured Sphingomonas sp. TaxID=158754 RepID=UPI0025FC1134|nr:hypothetical protein [uncultured Sphingomonas sp.]